jgi:catechol 2,3-dioxygenase-like lactoylglutathione lyase family enzyme
MKYHPTKIAPNFVVPDVEATAKYYCDVLGFTSVTYDGEPPGFALVEWEQVAIMFKSYPGVKAAVSNRKIHEDVGWDAYLWVADVELACAEIRGRGGRIVREIEETHYGYREFEVEDLNGLLLCFGQDSSGAQELSE